RRLAAPGPWHAAAATAELQVFAALPWRTSRHVRAKHWPPHVLSGLTAAPLCLSLMDLRAWAASPPPSQVYPAEGTPLIVGPSGVLKDAANPNAARLLQSFMFSAECQQLMVGYGGLRSLHALVKDKPGRKPLAEIKLLKDDPAAVEQQAE